MYEQVCFAHLVECRFERVDEMGGKFADGALRVRLTGTEIVDNHFAHCGVECKSLFSANTSLFAEHVHQGRFSGIGVADECHAC